MIGYCVVEMGKNTFTFFCLSFYFPIAILKNADLEQTSSKKVRQTLEKMFKCDFTDRRKEIDKMVMDYVNSIQNDDESEKSSDEEEAAAKKKSPPKKVAKKRKANSDSEASSNNDDSGDEYKPEKPSARAKKAKKAEAGAKKKGTGRKGR